MKLQQVQNNIQQKQYTNKKHPQFKSGVDTTLRFLATNQGLGCNLIDLAFMVIPRVGTDIKRGPDAAWETARREASGTLNHSLIGLYGLGAGYLLSLGLINKFGLNATEVNNTLAAPETIRILAENKTKQVESGKSQLEYIKETLRNVKAYNPTSIKADAEGYVKLAGLSDDVLNEFSEILNNAINTKTWKEWKNKESSDSIKTLINRITEHTGAQNKYILSSADGKTGSVTNLETLLEDMFKLSKTFNKDQVKGSFNEYISKLSKFMKNRSVAGFVIGSAIGMSIQPLNIYLTKLKTGSDGFVGVGGRTKDKSTEFKILKGISALGFGGLTLATMKTGFKGFVDKIAFKGLFPSVNQLMGIYGLTIMSRLLAARDKDELRESLTKDFLGYISWLVLGDIVNRLVAEKINNSVMNRTNDIAQKGFFKRAFYSKLKTRDEILIEALSEKGISTIKNENGQRIAKTFKEMLNDLKNINDEVFVKNVRSKLRTLNKAQGIGYLFTGIVLGLGIPNLNIYITNTLDKKRKAKQAQSSQQQIA
ncbi:hypothetical protein IJD34_05795 [bacterium]|nr:hypothetical protein [bacterium]